MLKCIICGKEYPEKVNFTNDGCHANPLFTTLYSTTIPSLDYTTPPKFEGLGLLSDKCCSPGIYETPLVESDKKNVWLKREDQQINGSFKSRKALHVSNTYIEKIKGFALASCGNQATALYQIKSGTASITKLYLPSDVSIQKLKSLLKYYESVTLVDRILSTKELINDEDRWNITNGMDPIGASAIYSLALELEAEEFDNIVVPMGSGELYSMLSVYFKEMRKQDVNIIPVKSHHPLAVAIKTDFVPMTPFIEHFGVEPIIVNNIESITNNATMYGCCYSSAVVFEAAKNLSGKTCLVITGAKQ